MPPNLEDQKRRLIADLALARTEILGLVQAIPEHRLEEVFLGEWCIKDLTAHLAGWDATNQQAVAEILRGEAPSFFAQYDPDWRSYNQKLVEKYRIEPFSRLIDAVMHTHRSLLTALEAIQAADLIGSRAERENKHPVTIPNLLRAEARDERVHAGQIKDYFHI